LTYLKNGEGGQANDKWAAYFEAELKELEEEVNPGQEERTIVETMIEDIRNKDLVELTSKE